MFPFLLISAFLIAHTQAAPAGEAIPCLTLNPTMNCAAGQTATSSVGPLTINSPTTVTFYACVVPGATPAKMTPGTVITPGVPVGHTPGVPAGITPGVPVGNTPGVPAGVTPGVPVGNTPGIPAGVTPGVPVGNTPGIPVQTPALKSTLVASQNPAESPKPNPKPAFSFKMPVFRTANRPPATSTQKPAEPSKPPTPVADNKPPHPKESESMPGHVYMCNDSNFSGHCVYFTTTFPRICYPLPANMLNQVSSIRPDKNQICRFYEGDDCGGKADWIRHPGTKNMRGRRFDNKVRSFKCFDECPGDARGVGEGGVLYG